MVNIRPFRGVRYNQQLFKDLSEVVCAPSDVITPDVQRKLYRQSKYNFVRLDAALGSDSDECEDARWQRAAATMEKWLDNGILQIDEAPAIYIHDYHFNYLGKQYVRRGIIAAVRLEEWDKMIIRRHEKILPELRKSRLSQIKAMKVNTSSLLTFFKDQGEEVSSLLSELRLGEPIISLGVDIAEGRHNVWAITEPKLIERICHSLAKEPIYIADGHHRYESALIYQAERRNSHLAASEDDASNFIMATLTPVSDPSLIVRPFHRLICGIPDSVLSGLLPGLKEFFEVEEWPLDMPNVWQKADSLLATRVPDNPDEVIMMIFGLGNDKLISLRARNLASISSAMPNSQLEAYKRLDVSIADQIIIGRILGITDSKKEEMLSFSLDRRNAIQKVSQGKYQLAILLRATRPEQIIAIADAGETMPEKSTRFYPKAPTGLVFHRLV